jgi:hypothetical protein
MSNHLLKSSSKKIVVVRKPFKQPTTSVAEQQPTTIQKLELVISHYEEDLKWIHSIDPLILKSIYIYHKGSQEKKAQDYGFTVPDQKTYEFFWFILENVGRESHSIYTHCLSVGQESKKTDEHYNILFVQGGMDSTDYHLRSKHVYPIKEWYRYADTSQSYICSHPGEIWNKPGMIQHHSKWLEEKKSGKMKSTNLTMAEYYYYITHRVYPKHHGLFTSFGNFFAVSKKRVQQHSTKLYRRIIDTLKVHINPEEGHYMEWMSRAIFGGTDLKDCNQSSTEIFLPVLD